MYSAILFNLSSLTISTLSSQRTVGVILIKEFLDEVHELLILESALRLFQQLKADLNADIGVNII